MFLKFYNLREQPFGVTPDPRFLYLSHTHREALASLVYGLEEERGFLAMIAQPGMGKTTLLFQLLERLRANARTAFLFNTQCDSRQLLTFLLTDLGVELEHADPVKLHEQLHDLLLRTAHEGQRCIFIIDEAQNLDSSVLETVRLLSNFETTRSKLLQIVISGQPSLSGRLAEPGLAQFRQRISIMTRLKPLSAKETAGYIHHRLHIAGHEGENLFTGEALERIAVFSNGIPRVINNLCFNALSLGYALGRRRLDAALIEESVADLQPHMLGPADLGQEGASEGSEVEEEIDSIPSFLSGSVEKQLRQAFRSSGRRQPDAPVPVAKVTKAVRGSSVLAFAPQKQAPVQTDPATEATTAISTGPGDVATDLASESALLESDAQGQPSEVGPVASQSWFDHLRLSLGRHLSGIHETSAEGAEEEMRRTGSRFQPGKALRTGIFLSLALAGALALLRQGESQGVTPEPVQAAPAVPSLPQAKPSKESRRSNSPTRSRQRAQGVGLLDAPSAASSLEEPGSNEAGSGKDVQQLSLLRSAEAGSKPDEEPAVPSFLLPEHYAERERQILNWILFTPPTVPSLAKSPVAPAPAGGAQK